MAERIAHSNNPALLTWETFKLICETLADTGVKIASCEAHGHAYATVYDAIKQQTERGDPEWKDLWEQSMDKFRESLEAEARKRARDGWQEPVYYKGARVGYIERKSDRLMEVMLRGHLPERYRDNVHVSGAVETRDSDILTKLSLKAQKEVRDIIIRDLKEQAEAAQAASGGEA